MSRIELTATVAWWVAVGITLVGCEDSPPAQPAKVLSENQDSGTDTLDSGAERFQPYVTCRATLTAFQKDYRWSDDSSVGHDDGVAPLASLVLTEPSACADRAIGVLFKYTPDVSTTLPSDEADIGSQFSVQLPAEFLKGQSHTIDNRSVRNLIKIKP